MRFVNIPETVIERITSLNDNYTGTNKRVRDRAQAIILSANGISRNKISQIIHITPDTISIWFNKIEEDHKWDLTEQPGRGRKSKITKELSKKI